MLIETNMLPEGSEFQTEVAETLKAQYTRDRKQIGVGTV